ncbi:hypothetical protein ABEV74_03880 [Paenibacillus cisolokensis]|uniref:alpha/beta fold hydrolase n=1 Tax=Paenibacillus cisolokensis TaxID=1658519 RepID=UPI003D2E96C2
MPFCKIGGANLYYEERGSGDAIIFTHGHSMFHAQWQPQVEALSPRFRTQAMAAAIRGSELRMVPGAGRLTNLDNPEEVNRHIESFMAGVCSS